ncbi:MAG TPA: hypothetical protein VIU12_09365 [Chryseolinea sp.]
MKASLLSLFLLAIAVACHCDKNEPEPAIVCGVVNPTENLPWLKAIIDDYKKDLSGFTKYQYVLQSTYEGNTVFVFGDCCPFCNSMILVKDCEGNPVEAAAGDETGPTTVIWKPENSTCEFTK